jgi:ABC-type Fe3+/spermidine/putrescine transport system ATPase subunit
MFQSQALFPHLTAAENVGYGLRRGRGMDAETREMVDGLLALAGLAGRARVAPAALTDPERRRLAFARSLARRPRVLLLDAPTAGLDEADRVAFQETLTRVQGSTGITTVLATDDAGEAARLATRIAVLDAGSVAEIGVPAELRDRPTTRAAARLVGRMNLLPARLVGAGDPPVVRIEGIGDRVLTGLPGSRQAFTLGVPPDAISVTRERLDPTRAIAGFVRGMAFLGGRRHVLIDAAEGAVLIVIAPAERLRDGDAVWLDWDDGRVVALER